MTRLVLVRHGESLATVNRLIGGFRSCTGLSPLGRRQSEALRDRWREHDDIAADVVIASNFARAQETAQLVVEGLGWPDPIVDADFGEHDPGPEIDGLSVDEYMDRFAVDAGAWDTADPFATTFAGGETVASFHYRVGAAMARVVAAHPDRTVAVFCHGGVVNSVLRHALHAQPMGAFELYSANTSITEVQLVGPGLWRMLRYNDVAHLAGLPLSTTR